MHRSIDHFTDDHEVTARAKQFFKPAYGLYAAAFVDVAYDHFLAVDKSIFSEGELELFANTTYQQLKKNETLFPDRFRTVFYYMQLHNWLYNYRLTDGIFRSFGGLVHRAKYMFDPQPACDIFLEHYEELTACYEQFFPELKNFAFTKMKEFAD